MQSYKVMFVDDEDYIRTMLTAYFESKFNMVAVDSAAVALDILSREHYDLVVSDASMPIMDGPAFLAEVQKRHPEVKRALLTFSNIDDFVVFARENAIGSIIPKTVPFNFVEVENIITGLLTGEIFGLARYLLPEAGVAVEKFCIKSSLEAQKVRDAIVSILTKIYGDSGDVKLVLDEMLMNAIYHAASGADSTAKRAQLSEMELEPSERIYVELGRDSEKYAISVLDNRGGLTRDVVLGKMERQITGAGFMDDSGRGLHICRLFADRLIINIERGKRTEVIVMNYPDGKYSGFKPIYINEV